MDGVLPVPAALGGDFVPLELSHGSEHSSGYLQPSTAEALSFDGAADEPPRAVTPPRLGGAGGRAARRAAAAAAAFALGGSVGQLEAAIAAPAFIESDAPCRSGPSCQICPPFTCASLDSYGRQLLPGGVRRRLIADEQGSAIRWPWDPRADVELQPTRAVNAAPGCPDPARPYFAALDPLSGSLSAHEADATVAAGLQAATSDGAGGENTTGVRAWKQFCGRNAREFIRPVAPEAPLWVKLHEEQWIMRFVAHLVDSRDIDATTLRPGDFCATGALTTINNKLHYTISSPLYFLHRSLQDTPERLECPERHKTAENTLRDTQNSQAAAGSRPPSPTLSHGTLSPRPEHTDTCVRASDGASS